MSDDNTMGGCLVPVMMQDGLGRLIRTEDFVRGIINPCRKGRATGQVCTQIGGHEGDCDFLTADRRRKIMASVLGDPT